MNEAQVFNLHIGDTKAFNGYKLIWSNAIGEVKIMPIGAKLAKALIADGMMHEG